MPLQCFCGDASSQLFKHGRSNSCTKDCGGNSRIKKCGGWLAISIFQYEGSPVDIPDDTDYVGCFADDQNDRALALKQTVNNAMTYEVHVDQPISYSLCSSNSFIYVFGHL